MVDSRVRRTISDESEAVTEMCGGRATLKSPTTVNWQPSRVSWSNRSDSSSTHDDVKSAGDDDGLLAADNLDTERPEVIGVGAQSTFGGQDIFARKYIVCMKN